MKKLILMATLLLSSCSPKVTNVVSPNIITYIKKLEKELYVSRLEASHQKEQKTAKTAKCFQMVDVPNTAVIQNFLGKKGIQMIADKQIPSFEEFIEELEANDISFPRVILAQNILECGYFQSRLAKNYNNLFGMNYVPSDTFAIGKVWSQTDGAYKAIYASWKDSVKRYKMWQDRKKEKISMCKTEEDYMQFLKNIGYATSDYPNQLRPILAAL